MMRSMYAAVAGLRTHQTRMDVIGDNIANVNTPGFKRARATFQDIFYQTLQGGSAGGASRGGTNPQQIGIGISMGTIDVIHTQGAAQPTGKQDDLMIEGDGFFVLTDGTGELFYTRAGAFRFLPYAYDGEPDDWLTTIGVQPVQPDEELYYLVNPANGMFVLGADGKVISLSSEAKSFNFDTNGFLHYVDKDGNSVTHPAEGDEGVPIAVAKFVNPAGLEKVGENLYRFSRAAGGEAPNLTDGGFSDNGSIIGAPGGERGIIRPGALEMSNVELAQEFTDMIVTQRGFQANARIISVSDEMLAELANLKR